MESKRLDSGGGKIPPEENPADKKHNIEEWCVNLLKCLDLAYQTKLQTKQLLYGKKWEHKELPVSARKRLTTERFTLKKLSVPVGHTFNLVVVKQYPFQQITDTPLFELEKFSDHYKVMDFDMAKVYAESYKLTPLESNNIPADTCAVVRTWPGGAEESEELAVYGHEEEVMKPILKRIKILGVEDAECQIFKVELIDHNTTMILDATCSQVYPLDKYFGILPPRICDIELEGLTYYKNVELVRRFLRYDSDEYIFDDAPVIAEVQTSGQVLIWNHNFPKDQFPYGINGFILKCIWDAMTCVPQLPPKGCERKGGYVVSCDEGSHIWLRFPSPVANHYYDVLSKVPGDVLNNMQGLVKRPEQGVIYLAQHQRSDGTFYRAEIISPKADLEKVISVEDKVKVSFIDNGDSAYVQVKTLVRAEDAHVLLPLFPRLCVKTHLENIRGFEPANFLKVFKKDLQRSCGVFVVKEGSAGEPAEVILIQYLDIDKDDENFKILNDEAVSRGVADHTDPSYDLKKAMADIVSIPPPNPLKYDFPLYLGLGQVATRRLQIGTELDVLIMWDVSMPPGWIFMRATHRYHLFQQMEMELSKLKKKILKSFKELLSDQRHRGIAVLVGSKKMPYTPCRGILLEECPQTMKESGGEMKEVQEDSKCKVVYWKVYLLDYGIIEQIDTRDIFSLPLKCMASPAFGILAKHMGFRKKSDAKEWWYTRRRRNINKDDINEYYKECRSEQTRVKILKLSLGSYGEMAVVDWTPPEKNANRLQ